MNTSQPDLFEIGERDIHGVNARTPNGQRRHPLTTCTPAAIGTGPPGETCGSCAHRVRKIRGKAYQKCGKMAKWWTSGAGTDIKCRWAACGYWEQGDPTDVHSVG